MGTESPILENHWETSSEMATHSLLAFDGGSGSGQPSATSQPAKRPPTLLGEANSTRPLSSWMAALRAGDRQESTALHTRSWHSPRLSKMAPSYSLLPHPRHPPSVHPVGAQFSLPSQIWMELRILPVSAVYHFEIYTILAERTELYCIHDAIKHFTRNQCKTDEAWK